MSEFQPLGNFVELQRGNTYKGSSLGQPGPILLGLASIARNGGFRGDNLKTYGGDSDPRILLKPGDVYVSLKDVTQSADLLGSVARVPDSVPLGRLTQDTVKLIFKDKYSNNTVIKDYIYWILRTPQYRGFCRSYATGTTNLGLPREDFLAYPIPPINSIRKTLLTILQSLNDKIELNRRMNETLEAMARAIFKDWFVDFGPTRAKQEGRAAYLPEHLWSLFPEAIDLETGLPMEWEEVTLNHHIQFNPSEGLKKGTEAPYLGMNALPTQGSISDSPVLREFTSGMRFRNGDTLFARITPCLENGKTAFVQNLASNEIGWGSTEFIVMRSIFPVPKVFSYLIARDPSFRAVAIQSMTGTSGRQRARTEALENYIFCNPKTTTIWECLGSVLNPMFDKIASHDLESRTLAELRDRLLPKLMSGEIRVKEAEQMVEEVM